jgi:multiple sugar transport system substrate-binding protein
MNTAFASASSTMTINGKKWGVPYTYYQWGIYHRKDIFSKNNLTPPRTWEELLDTCAKLKAAGITPFAIGSKAPWPTAGWFDYLDLIMAVPGLAEPLVSTAATTEAEDQFA